MDIKTMIEQYQLADAGDGTIAVYADVSDAVAEQIRAAKPQILAYLRNERQAAQAQQEQLQAALSRIPGVELIRKARSEDSLSPLCCQLQEQYPDAAFALRVAEGQKDPNYEYACICHDACRRLCQGVDPQSVRAVYNKACDRLHEKCMWD